MLWALWQRSSWSPKVLILFKTCKFKKDPTFRIPIDVAYPGARLRPLSRGNGISPWFEMWTLTPASGVKAPMYCSCSMFSSKLNPKSDMRLNKQVSHFEVDKGHLVIIEATKMCKSIKGSGFWPFCCTQPVVDFDFNNCVAEHKNSKAICHDDQYLRICNLFDLWGDRKSLHNKNGMKTTEAVRGLLNSAIS